MTFRSRKVSQEKSPVAKAAGQAASQAKKTLGTFVKKNLPATPAASKQVTTANPEQAARQSASRVTWMKRIMVVLIAVLCIGVVANIALQGIFGLRVMSIKSVMGTVGTPPPVDDYGHTNLLLLGVGDKNHDGIDLTDTIMIVSLDRQTQSIAMLSIPRDLWLTGIDHVEDGRVNTLFREIKSYTKRTNDNLEAREIAKLAMMSTASEISRRFGIEIHGVVKADFTGFVEAVDAIGGVDVVVPEDIIDLQYPDGEHPDQFDPFRISEGPQHLDGETALKYARSRHTSSDFGRSARQQQLLSAMAAKVREQGILKNPSTILTLLKIAGEHVEMTMGSSELIGLANLAMDLNLKQPLTIQLSDNSQAAGGFLYPPPRDAFGGASVLLPEDGKRGWQEIRDLVDLAMHRRLLLQPHQIVVENAGARSGLARTLGFELIRFGFNVVDIRNRPKADDGSDNDAPASVVQMGDDDTVGAFLAQTLGLSGEPLPTGAAAGLSSSSSAPSAGTGSSVSSLADEPLLPLSQVILAEEYTFTPLSTLLHPQP